ncbi:MAG TPA: hypothetical protein PK177_17660 [Burkholderiaceae bacterium]|nr:hypothetical protein [Burkholderiaceae bacterium]
MHKMTCKCANCAGARRALFASRKGNAPASGGRLLLSEQEEMELAMELLEISDEEEWEQFLGKVFKKIGRGIKKVGRFVGRKVLPKLGGALKGLAKKALPFVGGALGSLIPVPGVGTAIGTAIGSAASQALEAEFGELEQEDGEFEMARRFVRIAATAADRALSDTSGAKPEAVVHRALLASARQHLPRLDLREFESGIAGEDEYEGGYGTQAFEYEDEFEYEGEEEYGGQAEYEAEEEFEDEGEFEDETAYEGEYEDEEEFEDESRAPVRASASARAPSGRWLRRGTRIVLLGT